MFQIRSSIVTLFFTGKRFSWIRHILIAAAILTFNNLLVIFVPSIRDIFGFIGELWPTGNKNPLFLLAAFICICQH